jgi:type II secretory pathway pseudopilin PulG
MKTRRHLSAFTLLEITLSIGLLSILAGISLVLFNNLQANNDLDIVSASIAQDMRRAQDLSRAAQGDSAWGLFIQPGILTVFKGDSHTNSSPSDDEYIYISSAITISGQTEFDFAKTTGAPLNAGSVTLTTPNHVSNTVTINSQGMVSY